MTSPAFGLAWLVWQRHRLALIAIPAYLLALAGAIHTPLLANVSKETIAAAGMLPLTGWLVCLIAIFIHADADVAGTGSGYPSHLMTLPVRTRALVLWPMLYGMLFLSLAWIAVARAIVISIGIHDFPVWWPAAMLAALLACLQALFWSPVPLPYMRAVLAVLLLPGMLILGAAAYESGVPETVLTGAFLVLIPPAYLTALVGLTRARRGDSPEWHWPSRRAQTAELPAARHQKPFASAAQAQFWWEWKRNGIGLPLLVASVCLLFSLPLPWFRDTVPLDTFHSDSPMPGIGSIQVYLGVRLALACLFLPPWIAGVLACGARKSDTRRKDLTLHPFLATRPMSTGGLVAAKLKMAACSALAAWGVLLLFLGLWLLIPARDGETTGPLAMLLLRYSTPKIAFSVCLLLLLFIYLTWKNQVQGLFVDLTGRTWIVNGYPLVVGLGTVGVLYLIGWLPAHPDYLPKLLRALPFLATLAAVLKLLTAAGVFRALLRHRLMTAPALTKLLAAWLLLALTLFGLLLWLLPAGLVPARYLALGILLNLPLVRLALAPLSLEWNRHR